MKHHICCHCHFREQLTKFKAGKLGLLGSALIVLHLLFHVAECLVLPAIIMALHPQPAEAVTEPDQAKITPATSRQNFTTLEDLKISFQDSLETYALAPRP